MASTLTGGSATAIHMHQAFFGAAPTSAQLATYTTQAATDVSGFASGMASGFVNTSSKALALQVLTNLNITPATVSTGDSYATLLATLERIFNDYGLSARGQIILNATNLLAGLESDATYGVAAQNYNTQATAFYAQSSPAVASGGGGGGGTPTPTISGKLVDGYVSGATIFADANGNGVLDAGEAHTTTDSKGNFSLVGGSGPLVGSGGTDLSTGLAFRGILKAPAGSTMINPLTSLQQSFVAKGLSVADAQTKVATAMGFSGSVDLTTFDPLAAALGGGADAATGAALQAAAVKLANFMVAAGKTLEGAGAGTSETAGNALLESMADAINADGDGVIDLTDTALLRSVMNGAATLNHPSDAALLAKVASIADNFATMSAAAAKNVDDALAGGGDLNAKMVNIAQSAVVAQGDMADQLAAAAAATDPDAAMNALDDNYTDAAFANVANSATVGDLDPNSTTDNAAAAASNAATPPTLVSAAVNGTSLVLTYTEATTLDATNIPATSAFTVSGGNTVTLVAVNAAAKTVTLTLGTVVAHGAVVTVGYTDPTTGNDSAAVQDAAGNDAATITTQPVTNNTPDTTAPVFASAAVNGTSLVLTYTEATTLDATNIPATSAFSVSGNTVTLVAVNAAAKTVTLTLGTAVANGAAPVTVGYTDLTAGNDANAIQDAAGNDAATVLLRTVTNNTPDTTAPVFASATVNGTSLVLTYTEATTLDATNIPATSAFTVSGGNTVTLVAVNAAAKTVTLTLGTAVANGAAPVTVGYTDLTAGNDANAIQDAAGNDAATVLLRTVTNNTPDTTAPVFASAAVNGTSLVLTYTETNTLNARNIAAKSAFSVLGNTVTLVTVSAALKTVTLTLGTAVAHGAVVTVGYTDPTAGNDFGAIQDGAGNDVATITAQPVTNNTPDTTAPVFASAATSTDGTTITLTYNEALAATTAAGIVFAVTTGGVTNAVTGVSVSGSTVVLSLTTPVTNGQAVTVTYTAPTPANAAATNAAVQDAAGNDAATLASTSVTNNVPVDVTPPTASAFTSTATTVGATSNEAGALKLFNNADGALIGTAALVANVANTITVAAQPSVVTATLKVFDAADNEAAATKTVMLGTVGSDSTMFGTAAAEFIYGFDGADYIVGYGGGDTMTGGAGDDSMSGDVGNDTFNVDAGTDSISGGLTSGDILVVSAGAIAKVTGVSAFVATAATVNAGTATLNGSIGGISTISVALATGANGFILVGGSGVDTLTGSAQADTIRGGGGADIINVGTGTDTIKMTGTGQSFAGAVIVSGTTALTGIDKVTGMSGTGSDVIDLSAISTTFTSVIAGGTIANATGNTVSLVRGNFNNATGIFTADNSVTGLDTLVVYDANGTVAGTSVEAILLVGSGGVNANIAAGVITLA